MPMPRLGEGAVQPPREHTDPREDERERDELECGQRHELEQVHDGRGHEGAAQDIGEHHQARRVVAPAHDDRDEHAEEREDDAVGGAFVHELVDVHREESDCRQVRARACQQHADLARALGAPQVLQGVHVTSDLQREPEEQHPDHDHRGVEGVSREIAERPQLAELRTPPVGVSRRDHRDGRAQDQHHRHECRPPRSRRAQQDRQSRRVEAQRRYRPEIRGRFPGRHQSPSRRTTRPSPQT